MAEHWVDQGAEWLHVVNLDGAFDAGPPSIGAKVQRLISPDQLPGSSKLPLNLQCLQQIRRRVAVPIQFGGGLRSLDDIDLAFDLGADRVVLGTVAVKHPELVQAAIDRWGAAQIVVGIDARDGKVATHGWQSVSEVSAIDLGHDMKAIGVERVVYTDISRDGMLSGVALESTCDLGDMTDLRVIASGGVAGLSDIEALKEREHFNIEGVIVGQALYTGALDLAKAISIGHAPLRRRSAGLVPYRRTGEGIRVLLLYNHFFEQWQFPRGGVRKGEADLTCAGREMVEETGLSVVHIHADSKITLHYISRIRDYEMERIVVYYLAEIADGPTILGDENHGEYRWLTLEQAKILLMETSPEQLPAWEAAAQFFAAEHS